MYSLLGIATQFLFLKVKQCAEQGHLQIHCTHLLAGKQLVSNLNPFKAKAREQVWLTPREKHAKAFPKEQH